MTRTALGRAHPSHRMSSQPSPPPARSTRDAGTLCVSPSETTLYEMVDYVARPQLVHSFMISACRYLSGLCAGCSHEAVDVPQRACASSLSRDKEHMMDLSAAMTKTMLADAEVMHGLGPVPLLQRQSAVESRWTRTVPTSRESARKAFRKVRFCPHQKWMPPSAMPNAQFDSRALWGEMRFYRARPRSDLGEASCPSSA